jgi:hypothetical protein
MGADCEDAAAAGIGHGRRRVHRHDGEADADEEHLDGHHVVVRAAVEDQGEEGEDCVYESRVRMKWGRMGKSLLKPRKFFWRELWARGRQEVRQLAPPRERVGQT